MSKNAINPQTKMIKKNFLMNKRAGWYSSRRTKSKIMRILYNKTVGLLFFQNSLSMIYELRILIYEFLFASLMEIIKRKINKTGVIKLLKTFQSHIFSSIAKANSTINKMIEIISIIILNFFMAQWTFTTSIPYLSNVLLRFS